MKNNKKRILVTGGSGFIGANISKTLLEKGYDVTILDNMSRGFIKSVPKGAKLIMGDLRNRKDVKKALKGCEVVIHTAALLVIPDSFRDPYLFFENNVVGTLNLLEEMRIAGVKQLVFSSSAGVYAEDTKSPIHEEDRKFPYSPYGDSKLAMEHIMHSFFLAFKINVTILRYFNPYGPGYYFNPPQHAVPVFFNKALKNEPIPIYGTGKMQRDYIFIDDLVSAHLTVMKRPGYNIYNVGGGRGVSISEMVGEIKKISKSQSPITQVPTPPGYPIKMYADISKIRKEVGWKPKVSIAEGIKKTYPFFRELYK